MTTLHFFSENDNMSMITIMSTLGTILVICKPNSEDSNLADTHTFLEMIKFLLYH